MRNLQLITATLDNKLSNETTPMSKRGIKMVHTKRTMPSLVMLIPLALCSVFLWHSAMVFQMQDQILQNSAAAAAAGSSTQHRMLVRLPQLQPKQPHKKTTEYYDHDDQDETAFATSELRQRLPPSIWTVANQQSDPIIARLVRQRLEQRNATTPDVNIERGMELCGKFLYSTIQRAVQVDHGGQQTFVATGDIQSMWTRDSAVQIGIYYGRMGTMQSMTAPTTASSSLQQPPNQPYLRIIVEGAIRRQAFNIIQDPYGNAYARNWKDPSKLPLKNRVIGRGGWTDTRNYEVDSGAYFFTQLYDYYVAANMYRPQALLAEPIVFDAVMLMLHTYIVEQNHERDSPYRYFELPEGGKGSKTAYTGMTWSGFRPSDDKCRYGYLIPGNIHVAAGLERILELNKRIWNSQELQEQATTLLRDIESGIEQYGIVEVPAKSGTGTVRVYAYEVDGLGNTLADFDDANVPSLLSVPLLGWSGYDREVYKNTRARLLDPDINTFYYAGGTLRGIGSPHTPPKFVWPLAFAIEALTEEGSPEHVADVMAFQIQQSLKAACNDAMHEGVHSDIGCPKLTRPWFEWSNAMFVVLIENALGVRCDSHGQQAALRKSSEEALETYQKTKLMRGRMFYENHYKNNHTVPEFYQGVAAEVKYRGVVADK